MSALTVADYDRNEAEAEVHLPNRLIQACRPELFGAVGYPSRIKDDRATFRFVDVMHECRFDKDFPQFVGRLTDEEYALFRQASEAVVALTEQRYGRKVIPKGALLRAIPVFRHIRMVLPPPAVIVEVGAGSGYLTTLLGLAGYTVISTDVAQAFYLWQATLWDHLFGSRFIELATDPRDLSDFATIAPGAIMHVPWWKFTTLEPDRIRPPVDVVTANHMLCEMHNDAFAYLARQCGQWFAAKGREPAGMMFEGFGSTLLRTPGDVIKGFAKYGIASVVDDPQIHLMALGGPKDQPGRQMAERIRAGRDALKRAARIDLPTVRDFQIKTMGADSIWMDDEKFWRLLYGENHYG